MNDFEPFKPFRPSELNAMVERAVSRRVFLQAGAAFGISSFIVGTAPTSVAATASSAYLGFEAVAATTADTVTLPPGYEWYPLISWGDPLFSSGEAFDRKTRGTAASQQLAFGDNNDGMTLFSVSDGHGVFAVNNEYVGVELFHPNGVEDADDVRKSKAGHGISIFEVKRVGGRWQMVMDGRLNRRITADTPTQITGPARGHERLKTEADPSGTVAAGTWNNCGNGQTPWGTYLSCEESIDNYFASTDPAYQPDALHRRYGIGNQDNGYGWYQHDERFDISKHPNEPNRCGYVVEIDPLDPASVPRKHTALGRLKHENVAITTAADGRIVAYLGDDDRGEHLYRFISRGFYRVNDDAANRRLLEQGTLYVARFGEADENLSGRGEWVELSHGRNGLTEAAGFASQADIAINTRHAATTVGATTMDRPEWVAVNPKKVQACCALTNNKNRGKTPNAGGIATPVGGPNPRAGNLYGQILRWTPDNDDHASNAFDWDLYALAGNPVVHEGLNAGSDNITADNMFNGPDGIAFDDDGRLWIQTDGDYNNEEDYAGMGNNQMLCGDPESGEIRRFMVGPVGCEITGIAWSSDRTTMFVGIQHPGERQQPSHFPDGGNSLPRSTVIAITRRDGGIVGT